MVVHTAVAGRAWPHQAGRMHLHPNMEEEEEEQQQQERALAVTAWVPRWFGEKARALAMYWLQAVGVSEATAWERLFGERIPAGLTLRPQQEGVLAGLRLVWVRFARRVADRVRW